MLTTRNKVSSWFLYLGAVIGSTFGMLEIFVVIMGFIENVLEKLSKKKKRKIGVEGVIGFGYNLSKVFNQKIMKKQFIIHEITNIKSEFDQC